MYMQYANLRNMHLEIEPVYQNVNMDEKKYNTTCINITFLILIKY